MCAFHLCVSFVSEFTLSLFIKLFMWFWLVGPNGPRAQALLSLTVTCSTKKYVLDHARYYAEPPIVQAPVQTPLGVAGMVVSLMLQKRRNIEKLQMTHHNIPLLVIGGTIVCL